jgi:tRNA-binding EMAP/Myf-like protein
MKQSKPIISYSDNVIHIIGAADVDPFDKDNIYTTKIVELVDDQDQTKIYRVSLRIENKDKHATILYGDWLSKEFAIAVGNTLIENFQEKQKLEIG